jgi:hypothetical protein
MKQALLLFVMVLLMVSCEEPKDTVVEVNEISYVFLKWILRDASFSESGCIQSGNYLKYLEEYNPACANINNTGTVSSMIRLHTFTIEGGAPYAVLEYTEATRPTVIKTETILLDRFLYEELTE